MQKMGSLAFYKIRAYERKGGMLASSRIPRSGTPRALLSEDNHLVVAASGLRRGIGSSSGA